MELGSERVGPDGEDRVLARLVLAQLRTDARQQHREAERLGDIVIGAGFEAEDRVGIGVVAGQHDDRRLEAVLAQDPHRLAAVDVGQADIHDDEVDLAALGRLHALGAGFGRDRVELLMQGQLLDQGFAEFGIIVDDQNSTRIWHVEPPPARRASGANMASPT